MRFDVAAKYQEEDLCSPSGWSVQVIDTESGRQKYGRVADKQDIEKTAKDLARCIEEELQAEDYYSKVAYSFDL